MGRQEHTVARRARSVPPEELHRDRETRLDRREPVSLLIAEPERIQCCLQPPACAKSASENVASHTALFSRDIAREVER